MFLLDTDTFTLLHHGQARVLERVAQASREVVLSVISRIEVLQGRFDFVLRAANAEELLRAQELLSGSEERLASLPPCLPITAAAGAEFDRLKDAKGLRKIGRADLLIACIALANHATLVTRNLKHFQQVPRLPVENWAD